MTIWDQRVEQYLTELGGPELVWIPSPNHNPAAGRRRRLIVIHDMEYPERSGAARWCAQFLANPARRASAHYCVDADEIAQGVHVDDIAWAAPGANSDGIQIELAGYASQEPASWDDPYSRAELQLAAKLVAALCWAEQIPAVHLTVPQILAGQRGIVGHVDITRAYGRSDHTDPGPNFPWGRFLALVRAALDRLANPSTQPDPDTQEEPSMRIITATPKVDTDAGDDVVMLVTDAGATRLTQQEEQAIRRILSLGAADRALTAEVQMLADATGRIARGVIW